MSFRKITLSNGTVKLQRIQSNCNNYEEHLRKRRKNRKIENEKLAKNQGYDNYNDYLRDRRQTQSEKKGFKNWKEYRNDYAVRIGYKNMSEYTKLRRHERGIQTPYSERIDCGLYLGVYVAEGVLSKVFKEAEKMPFNNRGFDFICSNNYKIDVKSSCINIRDNSWAFNIGYNKIADYFLLIGFDNREDLNPQHIWLIKGNETINTHNTKNLPLNNFRTLFITNNVLSIDKYKKYELEDKLEDVKSVCNKFKNEDV